MFAMGNCASKPRKHRDSGASNDAIDALTKQFHPDVDGKVRFNVSVSLYVMACTR